MTKLPSEVERLLNQPLLAAELQMMRRWQRQGAAIIIYHVNLATNETTVEKSQAAQHGQSREPAKADTKRNIESSEGFDSTQQRFALPGADGD